MIVTNRWLLSCCIWALVAAPAYAGEGPWPVTVNAAVPQKPKPEVESHLTTPVSASASGSEGPALTAAPRGLTRQGTAPLADTGPTHRTRGGGDVITCSVNKEIVTGSVACANGYGTVDNQFARCFDAANFPVNTTVLSFDFGIEIADQGSGGPIEVIGTLYSIPASFCGGVVLPDAELTLLGSGSITLIGDGSENFTIQTISFGAGIAVPAGTNVVAEIA